MVHHGSPKKKSETCDIPLDILDVTFDGTMAEGNAGNSCVDCKSSPACTTIRGRDLCQTCFIKFIQIKAKKRMGGYGQKNAPKDRRRKLLLPLSYGVSSLSLFHIVDASLQRQSKTGRLSTGFDLHVLAIDSSTINPNVKRDPGRIASVQESYPGHTYSEIPFHSIFEYDEDIGEIMAQHAGSSFIDDASKSHEERLQAFRSSVTTPTSRTDLDEVLLRRLVVAFALSQGCDGVLWGDSDSRLAAKTLAHVSKGRGFSLPWAVTDGDSPFGVHFVFPLREVFKTELETYAGLAFPELRQKIGMEAPSMEDMSSRTMSIDDLLTQYVNTQGDKYPGVMANIVRTVNKLQTSPSDSRLICVCCGMPMSANQGGEDAQSDKVKSTCYGCERSLFDLRSATSAS